MYMLFKQFKSILNVVMKTKTLCCFIIFKTKITNKVVVVVEAGCPFVQASQMKPSRALAFDQFLVFATSVAATAAKMGKVVFQKCRKTLQYFSKQSIFNLIKNNNYLYVLSFSKRVLF